MAQQRNELIPGHQHSIRIDGDTSGQAATVLIDRSDFLPERREAAAVDAGTSAADRPECDRSCSAPGLVKRRPVRREEAPGAIRSAIRVTGASREARDATAFTGTGQSSRRVLLQIHVVRAASGSGGSAINHNYAR